MVTYLDHQATTPLDPRVFRVMRPWLGERFGNPHSLHPFGRDAMAAVEHARHQIAQAIGTHGKSVLMTSGATESANLALKGAARWRRFHEGRSRIVVSSVEHPCVLESAYALQEEGHSLTILPVEKSGIVSEEEVAHALDENTSVLAIMGVNHELGSVMPLARLSALAKRHGVWFFCDGAQALGKVPLDVEGLGLHMLSLSAHKIYGPQGIGALYVHPKVSLKPLFHGGAQQSLRPGTLPVALTVGMGEACSLAWRGREEEMNRLRPLRELLMELLDQKEGRVVFNATEHQVPSVVHASFLDVDSRRLRSFSKVCVSSSSACTSGAAFSHVLQAIGYKASQRMAHVRLCLGRFTTEEEVRESAHHLLSYIFSS